MIIIYCIVTQKYKKKNAKLKLKDIKKLKKVFTKISILLWMIKLNYTFMVKTYSVNKIYFKEMKQKCALLQILGKETYTKKTVLLSDEN